MQAIFEQYMREKEEDREEDRAAIEDKHIIYLS